MMVSAFVKPEISLFNEFKIITAETQRTRRNNIFHRKDAKDATKNSLIKPVIPVTAGIHQNSSPGISFRQSGDDSGSRKKFTLRPLRLCGEIIVCIPCVLCVSAVN